MTEEATTSSQALIHLEGAKILQKSHLVLSDVTLSINKGEFVFIIGKNGSGKSSFLKTLYAELKLEEGEGNISDIQLKKIKRSKIPYLRRKVGIIFQDFQLLTDRTVGDNLQFVLKATGWKDKNKINERIDDVLAHVDLKGKINLLPHELSGGEQQRIAIARSLLNEPEIILADEPTGNLDPETSEEIMKILHSISKEGKAIIMASHDYELMKKYATRILKFDAGKIEESSL